MWLEVADVRVTGSLLHVCEDLGRAFELVEGDHGLDAHGEVVLPHAKARKLLGDDLTTGLSQFLALHTIAGQLVLGRGGLLCSVLLWTTAGGSVDRRKLNIEGERDEVACEGLEVFQKQRRQAQLHKRLVTNHLIHCGSVHLSTVEGHSPRAAGWAQEAMYLGKKIAFPPNAKVCFTNIGRTILQLRIGLRTQVGRRRVPQKAHQALGTFDRDQAAELLLYLVLELGTRAEGSVLAARISEALAAEGVDCLRRIGAGED